MNSEATSSPRGERPGGRLVQLALVFYLGMGLVAVVWRLISDGQLPFLATRGTAPDAPSLARDACAGLAAGVALILVSRLWTGYTRMGRALATQLAEMLGPISRAGVVVLALASGLCEEAFFRGALQPRVGLLVASLLFGLAHLVPTKTLAPWAGFAALAGLLLGVLFDVTGNLLAPAIAHTLVNGVNLHWLSRVAHASRDPGGVG
jgi:membrane protease YdiL (CAAX protease family)